MINRLHLPFPISKNDMYLNLKRVPKERYKTWRRDAENHLLAQKRAKNIKPVTGPYSLQIILDCGSRVYKNGNRKRIDCGNYEAAVSDWLKLAGLITDDSEAESINIMWGFVGDGLCSVTVTPTMHVAMPAGYHEAAE